jgi:hypothetical protein
MRISSSILAGRNLQQRITLRQLQIQSISLVIHQLDKGELYQKISHDDSKLLFEPMGKGKGVGFWFIVSK